MAELQVSSGPFSGATFIYHIEFPADYPFRPPQVVPAFAGIAVACEEIKEGWQIYSLRSRQRGEVLGAGEEGLLVQWADGTSGFLEASDLQALGRGPSFALYHPLLSEQGHFCLCGLRDKWAPNMTITVLLSFARAAVEEAAQGVRPIPNGSCNEMCFCTVNGKAGEDWLQAPWRWYCRARSRFFGDKGLVPLCVVATGSQRLSVQCSSMAGTLLGELEVDAESSMEDLEHLIIEKISMSEGGTLWKLVLPDGACLSEAQRSQTVRELLT